MSAAVSIRVAIMALRGCAAVGVLGALCCTPAKALTFNWSFTITGSSPSGYSGTISGTIDNLQDNTINRNGMTATVTSAPFGPGAGNWPTLNYAGGNGIYVNNGVVDTTGLQAYFVYQGQYRLILQNPNHNGLAVIGNYDGAYRDINGYAYANGNGSAGGSLEEYYPSQNSAWNDGATPTFTPTPAPLPLLGLGAATAFSRKLKQRIALRRKREVEGDKA